MTIHQFATIAGNNNGKVPQIGDNCLIGAGSSVIGDVQIENNVTIAAGAVFVTDIQDNATVGGISARVIYFNHSAKYKVNPIK